MYVCFAKNIIIINVIKEIIFLYFHFSIRVPSFVSGIFFIQN